MKAKKMNGMMLAVVCATVLSVGVSSLAYAQQESHHKKKKNVRQAQQQLDRAQNVQQAQLQVDRAQYDQRLSEYRRNRELRQHAIQQSLAQVEQIKRATYYRYRQQYAEQRNQQWRQYEDARLRDYQNDPFFRTGFDHRYYRNGVYYETNRYGIEHINQAIQLGYAEGYQAGMADRQDRWRSDYERSEGYIDADYGYNGYYVSMDDYNYYFREGFRRGYEDGYSSRYRYGRFSNGRYIIHDSVLRGIFKFEVFRR
jgi:flagellar biosynthesis GTPase FlhF